jgi:hypothetical protein
MAARKSPLMSGRTVTRNTPSSAGGKSLGGADFVTIDIDRRAFQLERGAAIVGRKD